MRRALLSSVLALFLAQPASAISVIPTANAVTLETALLGLVPGLTVTTTTVAGQTIFFGESSTGVYTNASATYGVGPGIVMSSGDVAGYSDGPNTQAFTSTGYGVPATAAQEALLDPITGGFFDHFDVTQIDITFDVDATVDDIFFHVVFGSEEYPEFVGSSFIDGFGIYLNGVNIASVGGLPINIDHPDMMPVSGTELDGILAPGGVPVLTFAAPVTPGSTANTLTFIVADTSDTDYDTTVYVSGFGSVAPPTVPEPHALLLLAAGGIALVIRPRAARRRRESA